MCWSLWQRLGHLICDSFLGKPLPIAYHVHNLTGSDRDLSLELEQLEFLHMAALLRQIAKHAGGSCHPMIPTAVG
jgi:hypothetical protein